MTEPLLPLCGDVIDDGIPTAGCDSPSYAIDVVPFMNVSDESLRLAAQKLKDLKAQTRRHHTVVGEKSTYSVTLTHSPSTRKLLHSESADDNKARHQGYRNNYKQSVIENKNEYWRSKCWCEVQKRRKARKRIDAIDLMNRFQRYDRWERTAFRKVDWKKFYDEMVLVNETRPDFVVNPIYLAVAFLVLFGLLYWWLSKY